MGSDKAAEGEEEEDRRRTEEDNILNYSVMLDSL